MSTRKFRGFGLIAIGAVAGVLPVSYTHLDVYKRQGGDCTQAVAYRLWRLAHRPSLRPREVEDVYKRQALPDFLKLGGKKVEGTVLAASLMLVLPEMPDSNPSKKVASDYICLLYTSRCV